MFDDIKRKENHDKWIARIVAKARAGDFNPLIAYLEHRVTINFVSYELTPALAELLLEILHGKVRRRRGQCRETRQIVS
jgi:hypothetical protein